MTYRILIFLFCCFLIGNTGCRGGLFNDFKSLDDLAVPPHKAKLVVFANLENRQRFNRGQTIYIGKTRNALDIPNSFVRSDSFYRDSTWYRSYGYGADTVNATVELFKNDQLFARPQRLKSGDFNQYWFGEKIENDGATYKLRVSAAGFETVEAIQKMPNLRKLDSVRFLRKGLIINNLGYYPNAYEFMCFFTDSVVTMPNYYLVSAQSLGLYNEIENLDLTVNGNVLTDKNFDGKPFAWRVFHRNLFNRLEGSVNFEFNSMTRDAYLFEQSSNLYFSTRNNKFAEPSTLYSNIKNGYGIFALSAVSEFYLEF